MTHLPKAEAIAKAHGMVVALGRRVAGSLERARAGMFREEAGLLGDLRAVEAQVDESEVAIERHIISAMALERPGPEEMRLLAALLKITNDLERIGDYAVSVAKQAMVLEPPDPLARRIRDLGRRAVAMVEEAVAALAAGDPARAQGVRESDDLVDDVAKELLARLVGEGGDEGVRPLERTLAMADLCRRFERAADHANNIAEDVLYWLEGEIVRHGRPRAETLTWAGVEVDLARREIRHEGVSARLSRGEYGILTCLIQAAPGVVSRGDLLRNALGWGAEGTTRAVDQHISRLRRKLGPARHLVETVEGHGYRLGEDVGAPAGGPG